MCILKQREGVIDHRDTSTELSVFLNATWNLINLNKKYTKPLISLNKKYTKPFHRNQENLC